MDPDLTAPKGKAQSSGVVILIPARPNTFVEIDCEIFSTVNLLLPQIQERLLSVTSESTCICTVYWLTTLSSLPRKNNCGYVTDRLNMSRSVDWDVKQQTKGAV